ncbi:MAG TPA: MBL fold metallo-hydrolase, partial [Gammaproteobacteria bacterium]|nr:MBL fold metallo-hydrolase [Gammaproteobacteria bacterium]
MAAAGGTLLGAALPRLSLGGEAPLALTDLGGGLAVIEGAGANVVAAASESAVLLVDGGSAEGSPALLGLLAERMGGRPVTVLFNTNWRPERTGSNEALGASGTKIVAHENTKLWLGGDFVVDWQERRYRPRPKAALPTVTFYESGTFDFAGRRIDYRYLPRASTDGDVAVFFPDANVLVASDLVTVARYPMLDYVTGGWIGGFEAATKALLEITDAKTRIVPAAGAVCGRPALERQLELASTVRQRVAEAYRTGMSRADFVATRPTREFDAE